MVSTRDSGSVWWYARTHILPTHRTHSSRAAAESELQTANPTMLYSTLLSHVHAKLATSLSLPTTPELDTAFGLSVRSWKPFPDTCAALARLSKYYKLVVLSNVDKETFGYTRKVLESEGGKFDLVLTAQDIGSYKPDERNFRFMLKEVEREFGVKEGEVLVTAQVGGVG